MRGLLLTTAAVLLLAAPAQAVYHVAGTFQLDATTNNFADSEFPRADFAVDQQGNVFVLNKSAPWITKYTATGQRLVQFGSADQVKAPKGIATDATGGVYVSDESNIDGGVVAVFSTAGSFQRKIIYEDPLYGPGSGFTVDGTGHVYITDTDTQVIDGSGKKTGNIPYSRVDASDFGAIAGNPAGSGVFGRSNVSQGETVFYFDAGGTELGKLTSPSSSSSSSAFNWHVDGLATDTKGNLIIIDTYCLAAVVYKAQTLTDAAYLGSLLTPGKKAALRGLAGTDAAGDIFLEVVWGDGTFHIARIVPGSGSGNLPQKGCKGFTGGGGGSTLAATNPAQAGVPVQNFQNRRFYVAVACPSTCGVAVTTAVIIGGRKYPAGSAKKQLTRGNVKLRMPKKPYARLVKALKDGRSAKLRVLLKIRYADGSKSTKKLTLPLSATRQP